MKKWILFFFLLVPVWANAASHPLDYNAFSRIPVQHEGRIKPLGSFAAIMLAHIYGSKELPDAKAEAWLAEVLFRPSVAVHQKWFRINSHAIVGALTLPSRKDALYSFEEVAAAFAHHPALIKMLYKENKQPLTQEEQELTALYTHLNDFADMLGTFSLLLPQAGISAELHKKLGFAEKEYVSFLDLQKSRRLLDGTINIRLKIIEAVDKNNVLLRIIPPFWGHSDEWLSPWALIEQGKGSPESARLFTQWQQLAIAYRTEDAGIWNTISTKLAAQPEARPWALSLEMLYNNINPLNKALVIYTLGIILAIIALIMQRTMWFIALYICMATGAFIHGLGIAARMLILMRPPVSSLYESIIFVSFVAISMGLWLERKHKGAEGLLVGGMIAALLLAASTSFVTDDTMGVLIAVLNTNFWLATHVVCITTGYSASLITGMLAHLYLFKNAWNTMEADAQKTLFKRIHYTALVALLFTSVGTMLGGIWADQSWGRFWGWDPKENGALWIVLWLIWILHGRVSGQLSEYGFAMMAALLNIIVALAWVGVNLLSVGLHSYGFTDSAALGLITFCAGETAFIGTMAAVIHFRSTRQHG